MARYVDVSLIRLCGIERLTQVHFVCRSGTTLYYLRFDELYIPRLRSILGFGATIG